MNRFGWIWIEHVLTGLHQWWLSHLLPRSPSPFIRDNIFGVLHMQCKLLRKLDQRTKARCVSLCPTDIILHKWDESTTHKLVGNASWAGGNAFVHECKIIIRCSVNWNILPLPLWQPRGMIGWGPCQATARHEVLCNPPLCQSLVTGGAWFSPSNWRRPIWLDF